MRVVLALRTPNRFSSTPFSAAGLSGEAPAVGDVAGFEECRGVAGECK